MALVYQPRVPSGSSPLTRGKPGLLPERGPRGGLIPAHAGKTTKNDDSVSVTPAHPRSRGENIPAVAPLAGAVGSSPLTRGKHLRPSGPSYRVRLIPAHAGKTAQPANIAGPTPAHPRSRGENPGASWVTFAPAGSSPLTRGKLPGDIVTIENGRLIPAHAGKTSQSSPR